MSVRRYFDNAATSHPKPPAVAQAVMGYFEQVHASAGRGAYREALQSAQILEACRGALRQLFACAADDHVIFTLNGTDALNLALKATLRPGDHAITTVMDHNSVLRPLSALAERGGVAWTAVQVDPETTRLSVEALAAALRPNTRLVVISHASNVTGVIQPLDAVAEFCRARKVWLLVDAAQSAGHVPIEFARLGIDLLACPGHKGLLGPLGTGVLLIRAGAEPLMQTVREGGTGSASEIPRQPDELPDRFEAGSHNAPGLAGLLAAARWILERGVGHLHEQERQASARIIERLESIPGLSWYGPRSPDERVGVFSVRLAGLEPAELSALLEAQHGILTRSGLHCAPFAHQAIGTLHSGGTTRLSIGPFTTAADIDALATALGSIGRQTSRGAPPRAPCSQPSACQAHVSEMHGRGRARG